MKPSDIIKGKFSYAAPEPTAEWHFINCILSYLDEEYECNEKILKAMQDAITTLQEEPKYCCPNCYRMVAEYDLVPRVADFKHSVGEFTTCSYCATLSYSE